MDLRSKIKGFLPKAWLGDPNPVDSRLEQLGDLNQRVDYILRVVDYLEHQTRRQQELIRHLVAREREYIAYCTQTKSAFDFQWDCIPEGRYMLSNPLFREEAKGYVLEYTGFSEAWFAGKKVIDVGCGQGRYSWTLCTLGCDVTSVDQSPHGLERTRAACKDFPAHQAMQVDLLQPLPIEERFDLVWCYGVLHHTGDTFGAFQRVLPLVKPGGYIFLMLYGEPRQGIPSDYDAVNEYDLWRERTRGLSLQEKLEQITEGMHRGDFIVKGEEHIHGYFDAIAPEINDCYSWSEIQAWLLREGFEEITRTVDTRNHHLVARRPLADPS